MASVDNECVVVDEEREPTVNSEGEGDATDGQGGPRRVYNPSPHVDTGRTGRLLKSFFQAHADKMRTKALLRQRDVQPISHATAVVEAHGRISKNNFKRTRVDTKDQDGVRVFTGDVRLNTVHQLLARIDDLGFERSPNQVRFHEAFLRASGRCIYREEWDVHRRAIMKKNHWDNDCSEIMISTPRRFGKTFRSAIHQVD
jgi:hypothetical protein